jgi:hypothetical protein
MQLNSKNPFKGWRLIELIFNTLAMTSNALSVLFSFLKLPQILIGKRAFVETRHALSHASCLMFTSNKRPANAQNQKRLKLFAKLKSTHGNLPLRFS